jgi:cyclophilin family peptidyl-prolyl cis-trans isomerase
LPEDRNSSNERPAQSEPAVQKIVIDTAKGQIVMDVYPDLMPITVANFDKLVKAGFYNGLAFHRVEDWVIQGGDPKGNGTGGPGWSIKLETSARLKNVRGALAMARSMDPDSAGSQFYILKKDASWLDGQYAVFGMVVQGMDVVDQIRIGDKMLTVKE